jgi:23S rRNA pseudouridine1911/1915/1917 synthase
MRLDRVAADLLGDFSRARVQQWISDGSLRVDGHARRGKDRLLGGEMLTLAAAPGAEGEWLAQAMELDVVHEDAALLVINKPAGLVVHPGAGNPDTTLLNGLLHHCPELGTMPRAGIVHRLDKDTTGLLVIAKTLAAHHQLVAQLQARRVTRDYAAVVSGVVTGPGELHTQIGRHPAARVKMAVVAGGGKEAITHYHIVKKFAAHTWVRVRLETGRTHQIRVHMAHIGHPLVGDSVYGGRLRLPGGVNEPLRLALQGFRRQALHAATLSLMHPSTGKEVSWSAPLPADLRALIATLGG